MGKNLVIAFLLGYLCVECQAKTPNEMLESWLDLSQEVAALETRFVRSEERQDGLAFNVGNSLERLERIEKKLYGKTFSTTPD